MKEDDNGIITPSQVIHKGSDITVCSYNQAPLKNQPEPLINSLFWDWCWNQLTKALADRKTNRIFPLFTIHAPLLNLLQDSTFHTCSELRNLLLARCRGIKLRSPKDVHERLSQSLVLSLRISPRYRGTRSRTGPVNNILREKIEVKLLVLERVCLCTNRLINQYYTLFIEINLLILMPQLIQCPFY